MNNTAFRRLVLDTPSRSNGSGSTNEVGAPTSLGSRMRSSIPMTPRSVGGPGNNDFARQLAQRNFELNQGQAKKFRSSAAPKGTKLAAGYQDRTKLRESTDQDEKAKRVQALEEMVKLGQMDEPTFQKLRDEIVGGDVENVHLVKGLDFKLLRKMREDPNGWNTDSQSADSQPAAVLEEDVEDELEKLEEQAVAPLVKEEKVKQGSMAPPTARSRDEILKNLRAARNASAADKKASQPSLGSRFRKVGEKREASRIEIDEQGREVLILVDADGNVKRKVKKAPMASGAKAGKLALPAPDKSVAPLGMEVPDAKPALPAPSLEDLDIFDGVGTDFNPLGNEDESDNEASGSDSSTGSGASDQDDKPHTNDGRDQKQGLSDQDPPSDNKPMPKRNYFGDEPDPDQTSRPNANPLEDPTIQAALKRAANIQAKSADTAESTEQDEKQQKRKRFLDMHDRDAEDMDLGFGGSRMADDEDFDDGKRVKLSVWGDDEREGQARGRSGKPERKRGPKKKKGDAKNVADVMKVIERRKGGNS